MQLQFTYAPVLAALALLSGCGSGIPGITTAKVSGIVTYEGEPLQDAEVVFISDFGPRATASTDASGKYELTTDKRHDGAVPGIYKVAISKVEPIDPKNIYAKQKSLIPEKYNSPKTSGLNATVEAKPMNDIAFALKK